jgi:cytidylate kinase
VTGVPVITVDGPGGSGKGTISKAIAGELGWHFLDSGALYRLLALAATRQGIALDDRSGLSAAAEALDVSFSVDGSDSILLEGINVSKEIRTEEVGNAASRVASLPDVRQALLGRQRDFRRLPGLVADGRDMGSVVFKDADVKIYLTASIEERAKRRYKQLIEKGLDANLQHIREEIAERDARDTGRTVAPLKPAPDAIVIDTSDLSIDATLIRVREVIQAAGVV